MENNSSQKILDRIKNSVEPFFNKLDRISKDIRNADNKINALRIKESFYQCIVDTPEAQVYLLWGPPNEDKPKGPWRILIQIDSDDQKKELRKVFGETNTDIRLEYHKYLDGFLNAFADHMETAYKDKG